jgi:ubiquinol-cytochrome c reductase cytochrome b subunit
MGGAVVILFFLPWLDYSPVKSIRYRPDWHKYLYAVFVVNFVILAYLGVQPPSDLGEACLSGRHTVLLWFLPSDALVEPAW